MKPTMYLFPTFWINAGYNLHTLKMYVSELTGKTLILDFQGEEGKIRERYVRINKLFASGKKTYEI